MFPSFGPKRHVSLLGLACFLFYSTIAGQDCPGATADSSDEVLQFTLSFEDAKNHYVDVEMRLSTEDNDGCELMMPVWTPGSYLVRDYARHVDEISATNSDDETVAITKTSKNRWRVHSDTPGPIFVRYRLYCRELSVRTNFVDREFAMLNGAATFLTTDAQRDQPHHVRIRLPNNWKQSVSALDRPTTAAAGEFVARDFDHLVDSPIIVGNPEVQPFQVGGVDHYLVNVGGDGLWNAARATEDVAKIVSEQHRLWGTIPYRRYYFLNVIAESGGGLEHDESTLMLSSRWAFRRESDYQRWLGLVSHEFFHAWNIRTLRPKALVNYDYEKENYFPSLWIAEGITSYYDDLCLARSGVVEQADYLRSLGQQIQRVESTPGRLTQSLRDSSHDAWIKYYRQDEHSRNAQISYYTKGAVVGFLLDAKIRQATGDAKSLDDVMREVYQRYSGDQGYSELEFREVASEVAGQDLSEWFREHIDLPQQLDYEPALEWFGLELEGLSTSQDDEDEEQLGLASQAGNDGSPVAANNQATSGPINGKPDVANSEGDVEELDPSAASKASPRIRPWTGASTRSDDGRLTISSVLKDSPAYEAGMNVDDEIIAVNQFRVSNSNLSRVLEQFATDPKVSLTIARRGRLLDLPLAIRNKPPGLGRMSVTSEPTEQQTENLKTWLKQDSE